LYTYGDVKNVPEGTVVKDGNEILDKSEIYTYKNGSYSAFSNLFRFTMLHKRGGCWADTDLVCVKKIKNKNPYIICTEPEPRYRLCLLTSCFMKLQKDSEVAMEGIKIQREHKKKILSGNITWGSGPMTMNQLVKKFNLQKYVVHFRAVCSCLPMDIRSFINPTYKRHPMIINSLEKVPEEMFAIHMWSFRWSLDKLDKNKR